MHSFNYHNFSRLCKSVWCFPGGHFDEASSKIDMFMGTQSTTLIIINLEQRIKAFAGILTLGPFLLP